MEQIPGTGSTWRPAPGFRFGFNVPNNSEEGTSFFLCDLETDSFRKIKFKGQLYNWWSGREILYHLIPGRQLPALRRFDRQDRHFFNHRNTLSKYSAGIFGLPTITVTSSSFLLERLNL